MATIILHLAEPLERTAAAIAEMAEEARRHQVRAFGTVGTAGLRLARNRDEVVAAIRGRTGLTVEVIPGEEESRLTYLAVQAGLGVPEGSLAVFDTGGGSTEFTFGRGPQVEERFSVNVGGGALHRALRARRHAGPADPHRERPGPAPRPAGRPVRLQIPAGVGPRGRPGCWRASTGSCRWPQRRRPVNVRHTPVG
jgi:Ppx/GppA phosphatase family